MTDKAKVELKLEMLEDLIVTYNANFCHTKDRDIIEKRIDVYKGTLKMFIDYGVETWDEMEKKAKELDKMENK